MNKLYSTLAFTVIGAILSVPSAVAGPAADALTTCITDNTTGRDRKDLIRWIFVTMATSPEIHRFSNVTETDRDDLDKLIAGMATRLITENCLAEAKAAIEKEGSASFEVAFSALGRIAMQELTADPAVKASFSNYAKYLDKAKFKAAFADQ